MERLTKAYDDGTHAAADNLPCGENSWNYKELLLNKLGAYEDTGLEPCEILVLLDRLKRASEQWNIWCDAYQKDVPVWIPVAEQLPGTERILITDGEVVKEGYRRPDGIWKYGVKADEIFLNLSSNPVVAWMPLPEPYKPEN